MSADIITVGFCPQYFSDWKVAGSRGETYDVTLNGAEQMPSCTCPAFKFSKREDADCKHVRAVWQHGCLFNPQWKDPGPNDYASHGITLVTTDRQHVIRGDTCPGCGEDMIAVRIAV